MHICYHDAATALRLRQPHSTQYHAVHPKGYWLFIAIQDAADPTRPEDWVYQLQCMWKRTAEPDTKEADLDSLERHWRRAEQFAEPFRSAHLQIPAGTKLHVNKMAYWVPQIWDTRDGRLLIAGNAAHAMTFRKLNSRAP
ncbi:hypothetical protein BX600DRAFT_443238 [Xylariales sp. PMI_506]|nr:hypothetical protein BX600DRAFT_443238 [Xylariales sp. PMI_506]